MNNKIESLIKKLKTKANNNEERNERNTKTIELYQHKLSENEEDNDEILKLKLNNSEEIRNEIDKIIETKEKKEKNQEKATSLIFLKSLFEKIITFTPKIQIQIETKCVLISSNRCCYESSEGEIIYNNNDSIKIIHLSCGHYIHEECLRSTLTIYNYNIEELTSETIIKCPSCHKDVNTLL
ncbi:hypothetical protein H8356DRAFT_1282521 [Neocallimastix lanati (nom. inval.)]|nr:hypothetical protein H8356DRAFT_1282521 [Neocallimastix sp. JGI-2020a]